MKRADGGEEEDLETALLGDDGAAAPVMTATDKKSLCVSIATLLLSIPALIGA